MPDRIKPGCYHSIRFFPDGDYLIYVHESGLVCTQFGEEHHGTYKMSDLEYDSIHPIEHLHVNPDYLSCLVNMNQEKLLKLLGDGINDLLNCWDVPFESKRKMLQELLSYLVAFVESLEGESF